MDELIVIGGGLAGAEAAWQAAVRGVKVWLYEMRPRVQTGAHIGGNLAELVCSNSLGSNLVDRASGLLKAELRRLGSMVLECADQASVPAGRALAVDRQNFSERVTDRILRHPNIHLVREEVKEIPEKPVVIASGPLTSPNLSDAIAEWLGRDHLYFFDAIAPIVLAETVDMDIAFRGSRYEQSGQSDGDYINCPMNQDQYAGFVTALAAAERIKLKDFEIGVESEVRAGFGNFFEGCLPIEVLALRSPQALAFGPLRPIGLTDPKTGKRPYANVQLRQDNLAGSLYNLVGFQTNLTYPEQKRVFGMIPGLERAEFVRFGQMHRNTFIYSPDILKETLQSHFREDCFFAGQIIGVEGYVGNIATGLVAGWNAARVLKGQQALILPRSTMIGALCSYIVNAAAHDFQPMKANYGLLPILEDNHIRGQRERASAMSRRALARLDEFILENPMDFV